MANQADLFAGGCNAAASTSLENSHIFRTGQALYYGSDGRNTDAANTIYIWIFDSATVPANGSMPFAANQAVKHIIQVPASQNFAHGGYINGELFLNGVTLVVSTTDAPTLTISGTAKTFIECDSVAEYGLY